MSLMRTDWGAGPIHTRVGFGWIKTCFKLFIAKWGVWLVTVFLFAVPPVLISWVLAFAVGLGSVLEHDPVVGLLSNPQVPIGFKIGTNILTLLYQSFLYGGIYKMAVKQVLSLPLRMSDLFAGYKATLKIFGFLVLCLVVFSAVTILLPVTGGAIGYVLVARTGHHIFRSLLTLVSMLSALILSLGGLSLLMPVPSMLADGVGLFESISQSIHGMKKDLVRAMGLIIIMGVLIVVSALPYLLGLFITLPMMWLLSALAYREVMKTPSVVAPDYGIAEEGVWPPPPSV